MPPMIGCLPRLVVLALAVVGFLAISLGLARVLSANNAERDAIERLLTAQARGDAATMIARIDDCATRARCRARARANAARLRSTGALQIVRLDPSTSFSLGGTEGTARVVWRTPDRTTVVQCVRVRRGGDVLRGLKIVLRSLSRPIPRTTSCPSAG
jgi:hypothetical protein